MVCLRALSTSGVRLVVSLGLVAASGCKVLNPEFDGDEIASGGELGEGDGDGDGEGEGEASDSASGVTSATPDAPGDGDGDGTQTAGDGDGEAESTTEEGPCGELVDCFGSCVDLDFDDSNCGMCGNKCPEGSYCEFGSCEEPERVVFVSSGFLSGQMGGIAGAHAHCQAAALEAGLEGEFKAWLATEGESPVGESFNKAGSFILSDGETLVAQSWADLTDGSLLHPIDLTEFGEYASGPDSCNNAYGAVWTGVTNKGELSGDNCGGWTSTQLAGKIGLLGAPDYQWTETECVLPCFTGAPIYCFEQ